MKPVGRAQGKGIFLFTKLNQVNAWKKDHKSAPHPPPPHTSEHLSLATRRRRCCRRYPPPCSPPAAKKAGTDARRAVQVSAGDGAAW